MVVVDNLEQHAQRAVDVGLGLGGDEHVRLQHPVARVLPPAHLTKQLLCRADVVRVLYLARPVRQHASALFVPQLLVLGREVDLHHGVHGVGAPLAVLAAAVEVRQGLVRSVRVALRQPLAEAQPGVVRRRRRRPVCTLHVPGHLLQAPAPPQELHQLRQRAVVTRVFLEQLLKVVDGGFVMFLLEHELGQHQARLLVVAILAKDAHAHLLTPVHISGGQSQSGQCQHRRQVSLVVLERLVEELRRALHAVRTAVLLRDGQA
mmetsp:Transcript_16041/g.39441  ORF Transcript_16041/g.39441 Transcript_16041/m.39441 type:complete len:262 (+) Transcript_16041:512-1297(+)